MTNKDLQLFKRLLTEIQVLLKDKDDLGISNMALEFSGITSHILYGEGVDNASLVLLVDGLIQDSAGGDAKQITERFELLERVLRTIYERVTELNKRVNNESTT